MQMAENEMRAQIPPRKLDSGPRQIAPPEGIIGRLRYQPGREPGRRNPAAMYFIHFNVSRLGELPIPISGSG